MGRVWNQGLVISVVHQLPSEVFCGVLAHEWDIAGGLKLRDFETRCKWFLDGLEHYTDLILSVFGVAWCSRRCFVYFLRFRWVCHVIPLKVKPFGRDQDTSKKRMKRKHGRGPFLAIAETAVLTSGDGKREREREKNTVFFLKASYW